MPASSDRVRSQSDRRWRVAGSGLTSVPEASPLDGRSPCATEAFAMPLPRGKPISPWPPQSRRPKKPGGSHRGEGPVGRCMNLATRPPSLTGSCRGSWEPAAARPTRAIAEGRRVGGSPAPDQIASLCPCSLGLLAGGDRASPEAEGIGAREAHRLPNEEASEASQPGSTLANPDKDRGPHQVQAPTREEVGVTVGKVGNPRVSLQDAVGSQTTAPAETAPGASQDPHARKMEVTSRNAADCSTGRGGGQA